MGARRRPVPFARAGAAHPPGSSAGRWSTRCSSSLGPAASGATCPANPPWGAVWQPWRRWRANGVWAVAMARLGGLIRILHGREPLPSKVIIGAQTVKGGRYGPRTTKPVVAAAGRSAPSGRSSSRSWDCPWRPASSRPDRTTSRPAGSSSTKRCFDSRGCPMCSPTAATRVSPRRPSRHGVRLVIKAPPAGRTGFTPIAPVYKVEHAFAQLGRWRRLSRCFEGTAASARAWLEVACLGYLFSASSRPGRPSAAASISPITPLGRPAVRH